MSASCLAVIVVIAASVATIVIIVNTSMRSARPLSSSHSPSSLDTGWTVIAQEP
jgi:hypothetical protein